MEFEAPIVTLEDAKRLFQAMGCSSFHMSRDYPERYGEYRALGISKDTESQWMIESILDAIKRLRSDATDRKELWSIHAHLTDLVLRGPHVDYLKQVLDVTNEIKPSLSPQDCLIVAGTILGRQNLRYRPGLIFRSHDVSQQAIAEQFARLTQRLIADPSLALGDDTCRRELRLALLETATHCQIHLD